MACGIIQGRATIKIVSCCVLIMHMVAINQGSLVIFSANQLIQEHTLACVYLVYRDCFVQPSKLAYYDSIMLNALACLKSYMQA